MPAPDTTSDTSRGASPDPARAASRRPLPPPPQEEVSPELAELVETLEPNPAYVSGARWDVLVANRPAQELFRDWDREPADRRNMLWFYLADPRARELYVDWEQEAADQLAHFRSDYARRGDDPSFDALLEAIFERTPQARRWWEEHSTQSPRSGPKRVRLPHGQVVHLRQLDVVMADDPGVHVTMYFADLDADSDRDGPDELDDLRA